MSMNIKPENRRLLEALEYIDDKIILDVLAEVKVPDAATPGRDKRVTRRSIRYALTIAACFLLISTVIPVASYIMRHYPDFAAMFSGETTDTSDLTDYETLLDETTTPPETECTVCDKKKPSEGLSMKLIDKSYYSVSRLGDCTDKDIVIPATYEGLPVLQIERNAFLRADITSITIPSSIKVIKASAFSKCDELKSVFIHDISAFMAIEFQVDTDTKCKSNPLNGADLYLCGEKVTDLVIPAGTPVAPFAFYGCTSVKSLTFSEGTTHIGSYAFAECVSLEEVRFSSTVEVVGMYAFDGCEAIKEVHAVSIESWCDIDFWDEQSTVYIPSNPMAYSKTLLIDGKPVTELVIPASVGEVKPFAFYCCETLTSVVFEEGVKKVGSRAFFNCDALGTVSLPSTLEKIDNGAFVDSSGNSIQRINIASVDSFIKSTQYNNILDKDTEIFYNGELLTSVVLPSGTKILGITFSNYTYLNDIIINNGLEEIVDRALANTSITSINIPEGVTKIGAGAFSGCTALSKIILPTSLETIEGGAFRDCTSLRSLELPEKIDTISEYLFVDCLHLNTLTIHNSVKLINLNAFIRSGVKKINYLGTYEEWKNVTTRISELDYDQLKNMDEITVYSYGSETTIE